MTLTMKRIERDESAPRGRPSTVAIGVAETAAGREVRFGGDTRMMQAVADAMAASRKPIRVEVESWQIIA